MNKNLNDMKLIFLELAHLDLYSGKVWENRFFSILQDLGDPYSKLLLIGCHLKGPCQSHLCFCLHTTIWLLHFLRSMSKRRKSLSDY